MKKIFLLMLMLSSIAKGLPITDADVELTSNNNWCWVNVGRMAINDILKDNKYHAPITQPEFFNSAAAGGFIGGTMFDVFSGIRNCFRKHEQKKSIKFHLLDNLVEQCDVVIGENALLGNQQKLINFTKACELLAPYDKNVVKDDIVVPTGYYSRLTLEKNLKTIDNNEQQLGEEASFIRAAFIDSYNLDLDQGKGGTDNKIVKFLITAIIENNTPVIAVFRTQGGLCMQEKDPKNTHEAKVIHHDSTIPKEALSQAISPIYDNKDDTKIPSHYVLISGYDQINKTVEIIDCRQNIAIKHYMTIKKLKLLVVSLAYAEITDAPTANKVNIPVQLVQVTGSVAQLPAQQQSTDQAGRSENYVITAAVM